MRNNAELNWKDNAAIKAMQSIISSGNPYNYTSDEIAAKSYKYAESMFNEREKDEHSSVAFDEGMSALEIKLKSKGIK